MKWAKFVCAVCGGGYDTQELAYRCSLDCEGPVDVVNSPGHYTQGGIEAIDAIKASMSSEEFEGYLKGNVMKYVWRYRDKEKPMQDLQKARWYLDRLINEIASH